MHSKNDIFCYFLTRFACTSWALISYNIVPTPYNNLTVSSTFRPSDDYCRYRVYQNIMRFTLPSRPSTILIIIYYL